MSSSQLPSAVMLARRHLDPSSPSSVIFIAGANCAKIWLAVATREEGWPMSLELDFYQMMIQP
ncbi:MAG: hypothetical protein K6T30_03490, partial [Alicyclobacillus sp.]|nr:hypothetical protein [Alicyclobacillus sp.]